MTDNKIVASMTAFVVILGGATVYGVHSGINTAAQESVEHLVQKLENQDNGTTTITYGAIKPNYLDQTVTVSDVVFEVENVGSTAKIASVTLDSEGYVENEQLPTSVDITVNGLEIVHDGLRSALNNDMGANYFDHVINGSLGYSFDKEGDTLTPYGNLAVSDMNEVSINLTVSNIRGAWNTLEANYAANDGKIDFERKEHRDFQRMMRKIRINELDIDYANKGEIEKLLENLASDYNLTIDELQMGIPEMVDRYLSGVPFAKDVQTFLKNPKTLSLSFVPESPMTPEEFSERLRMMTSGYAETALEDSNFKLVVNKSTE